MLSLLDAHEIVKLSTDCSTQFPYQISDDTEIGWDLEPGTLCESLESWVRSFAPSTPALDKLLQEQENTKKLQGIKNNCACAFGANYKQQETKRSKTQLPLLRYWKQRHIHDPCTQHQEGGKTT